MDFLALYRNERTKIKNERNTTNENNNISLSRKSMPKHSVDEEEKDTTKTVKSTKDDLYESFFIEERPSINFKQFKLGEAQTIYYIPDWVTASEERFILNQTYSIPDDHQRWVRLRERRLQCWGGQPDFGNFVPEPLPEWQQRICQGLVDCGAFSSDHKPNHVLLNEYEPGQGIIAHTDGPSYFPRVAILSLGSPCVMNFMPRLKADEIGCQKPVETETMGVILAQRSLLLFSEEIYSDYLHGIDFECADLVEEQNNILNATEAGYQLGDVIQRQTRVSLTIRHVSVKNL